MTFEDMVAGLAKPGKEILDEMSHTQAHVMHMAIGIAGEAGELLDAIKKNCIYQKPLDFENVIEELGDIEFYLEGIRQSLRIERQQTLDANIEKLGKRYKDHRYSNTQAQVRADKK